MKIAIWLVLGLAICVGVAWGLGVWDKDPNAVLRSNSEVSNRNAFDPAELELRITMLETQLAEEAALRRSLEAALDSVMLEQWSNSDLERDNEPDVERALNNLANLSPNERREQFFNQRQERQANQQARRVQRLEAAGFSAEQTASILAREEELRLVQLEQQWEQRRERYLENADSNQVNNKMREELGEADYERYLQATGRPTSVHVSQLVNNSQAAAAGFQAGDEIVRYNGERIYNMNDLNLANVQGDLGETVVSDVVSDGSPMQLVVARGPLGIVSGRRRGFRNR